MHQYNENSVRAAPILGGLRVSCSYTTLRRLSYIEKFYL